jgi:hypothetical protein
MKKNPIIKQEKKWSINGQKKTIKLRQEVNRMYFEDNIAKIHIANKKHLGNKFVIRWTQSKDQDFSIDKRGWSMGKLRKWDSKILEIIREIHQELVEDPQEFFSGATAIAQVWRKKYAEVEIPPLRTIGYMMANLGLSGSRKKNRHKGAARYLCYPEYTIHHLLGGKVLEADFIQKHIMNRTEPLHFVGFSFKNAPKLRHYKRIEAQTSLELRKACDVFFKTFEKPDYIKTDNGAAMVGTAYTKNKRNVSEFMFHMLSNEVIPIFSVPRKPFSQASIEGNNSVFSRKFWNRIEFESVEEVDEKLEWFNNSSMRYSGYSKPEKLKEKKNFIPKVYFIRQVREYEEKGSGYINVLNENVKLPQSFINYFVLAEWNLIEEKLYIRFEQDEKSKIIKELDFKINENSKKKMQKKGVSFHFANNL